MSTSPSYEETAAEFTQTAQTESIPWTIRGDRNKMGLTKVWNVE